MRARIFSRALVLAASALLVATPIGMAKNPQLGRLTAEGTNNAAFAGQSVPSMMVAGQSYTVTVAMTNSGTSTWTANAGYSLGSVDPPDNIVWGVSRVPVPSGRATTPGRTAIFQFVVRAPLVSGIHNFRWQMLRTSGESGTVYFGEMSPATPINVIGGTGGPDDAAFVSQSVTTPMVHGQLYPVTVTMRNTGTSTWTAADGYSLVAQSPPHNATWGVSSVPVPGIVEPGHDVTFEFTVTAPANPSVYTFQWQMFKADGDYFGQISDGVAVNVHTGEGENNACFVRQIAPRVVKTGQLFGVTVVMRNTGTTTWTANTGYWLASERPAHNATWGTNSVPLPCDAPHGLACEITFNVVAPAVEGAYTMQWCMFQQGVGLFGEPTEALEIKVEAATHGDSGLGNNLAVPVVFAEGHGMLGFATSTDTGLRPRPEETPLSFPFFDPYYVVFLEKGPMVYPQKTPSTWQAEWANGDPLAGEHTVVNWSDNLLSTKWTPKQAIRVENALYEVSDRTMRAYRMWYVTGEGTTEVWATDATSYESNYRSVYCVMARLKVEKITGPGGSVVPHPASFDGAVYEKFGVDGPGGYTAEVNVSGNLIYGFNWQLGQLPGTDASKLGWWRLTFMLDPVANYTIDGQEFTVPCNTQMVAGDPLDQQGKYFKPVLVSPSMSVLEIEIVSKKPGGGGGGETK